MIKFSGKTVRPKKAEPFTGVCFPVLTFILKSNQASFPLPLKPSPVIFRIGHPADCISLTRFKAGLAFRLILIYRCYSFNRYGIIIARSNNQVNTGG